MATGGNSPRNLSVLISSCGFHRNTSFYPLLRTVSHEADFEIAISLSIHAVQIFLAKDETLASTEAEPIEIYCYHILVLF
jgi:hypothetical protein